MSKALVCCLLVFLLFVCCLAQQDLSRNALNANDEAVEEDAIQIMHSLKAEKAPGHHAVAEEEEVEIEITGSPVGSGVSDQAMGEEAGEHTEHTNASEPVHISSSMNNQNNKNSIIHPNAGYEVLCNDKRLEPTLADVISYMIPTSETIEFLSETLSSVVGNEAPGTDTVDDKKMSTFKTKGESSKIKFQFDPDSIISKTEIPIAALISDGIYEFKGLRNVDDVYMIQQNYASINYFCGSEYSHYLGPLREQICRCWGGESHIDDKNSTSDESQLCKKPVVCDERFRGNCRYKVDPFRTSCIMYPKNAVESITYTREIPVLELPSGTNFEKSLESFGNYIDSRKWLSSRGVRLTILFQRAGMGLDKLFSVIPSYLARIVGGVALIGLADDLSSSMVFQYFLAGTLGVFMAFLYLFVAISRQADNMLKSYLPAALSGFGMILSFWAFNERATVLIWLYKFWSTGAPSSYQYAGKIYFGLAALFSISLTSYIGFFKPKTNSHYVLYLVIKMIGGALLTMCTSNTEISSVFFIYGLFQDYILYFWYRSRLSYEASKQKTSSYMMGRPLYSSDELKRLSSDTTVRELEKLRQHLNANPEQNRNLQNTLRLATPGSNQSSSAKSTAADMLDRFSYGMSHLQNLANIPLAPNTPGSGFSEQSLLDEGLLTEEELKEYNAQKKSSKFFAIILFTAGLILVGFVALSLQQSTNENSIQDLLSKVRDSVSNIMRA